MGTSSKIVNPSGPGLRNYPPAVTPPPPIAPPPTSPPPTLPPPPTWTDLKRQISTTFAAGTLHTAHIPELVRSVRLRSGEAARGLAAPTVQNIGEFLTSAVASGVPAAAEQKGLPPLAGLPREEALAQMVDFLVSPTGSFEEADLRQALYDALQDNLGEELGDMDAGQAATILVDVVTNTLFNQIIRVSNEYILAHTPREGLPVLERQIRDYLRDLIRQDISTLELGQIDWQSAEMRQRVAGWLGDTKGVFNIE